MSSEELDKRVESGLIALGIDSNVAAWLIALRQRIDTLESRIRDLELRLTGTGDE